MGIDPLRSIGPTLAVFLLLLSFITNAMASDELVYRPDEVYRSPDGTTSVEALGNGVFLFRWWPGLYVSPFLVGDREVLAVDPVNPRVAADYRRAIAAVTDFPITKVVYSHDHRDHIGGAGVLAPKAEILAHPGTVDAVHRWSQDDIPVPSRTVDNGDVIAVGGRSVGVHYFGPNHGNSNIALSFNTGDGNMLVLVDTIEIGIVPYRTLPDTNYYGYLSSLEQAIELEPRWVLGGHSGPGPGIWLQRYRDYFLDMATALAKAEQEIDEQPAAPGEDFIVASERHIQAVIDRAVALLRPRYGRWRGFEQWAPMNAQTIRMAITIGK